MNESISEIRDDARGARNAALTLTATAGMSALSTLMPHEAALPRTINAVLVGAFGALAVVAALYSGNRYGRVRTLEAQPSNTVSTQ